MLPDEMILQLSIFVFCPGSEAANHANVAGLGKDPLLWHRHLFNTFSVKKNPPQFYLFFVRQLSE